MAAAGRLAGKVAVVTGGGSGIGRAVCRVFANEGASIAVLDVNSKGIDETISSLTSDHGNKHCAITVDVASESEVVDSVKFVEEKLGKINILVNGAGITRGRFLHKMSEKQFDDVMNVNLKGSFLMAREFLRSIAEPRSASIINIASVTGKHGAIGHANYTASKAGLVGLTRTISLEFASRNVRCNAVLPGYTRTPMVEVLPPDDVKKILREIPLKRQGEPEEIAKACLFLASDDSSYVTGTMLDVSGGLWA